MDTSEELTDFRNLRRLIGDWHARQGPGLTTTEKHCYERILDARIDELAKDELVAVTLTRHDWGIVLCRNGIQTAILEERIADTIEEQLAS